VYLPNTGFGYNQSHVYQHLKSTVKGFILTALAADGTIPTSMLSLIYTMLYFHIFRRMQPFRILVNNNTVTSGSCLNSSVIFNLFDPVTLKPYYNQPVPSTTGTGTYGGFMGSYNGPCSKQGNQYNFQFSYLDNANRRKMRDFMDWIPNGVLVTMRLINNSPL
jgi:hypothetical protein